MAISRSNAEYYNLEKVAEVLSIPTAEVNRLREQSKLRGFRDGSNWKFLKEDIHTYLAESIKARSGGSSGRKPGESDFDLGGGGGSPSSFDLLMEDAALPHDSDLVSVSPSVPPSSDVDLAALDNEDDLALAEETQVSSLVVPKRSKHVEEPKSEILRAVQDDHDSSALILEPAAGLDALDDDDSVLGASGSSPQLGLAGDSGFDVLVAGEEENILVADEDGIEDDSLLEVEEKTESVSPVVEEFSLEPPAKVSFSDDSESSSQVIAIDAFAEAGQDTAPFGEFSDFVGFDSGIHAAAPSSGGNDPFAAGAPIFDPIAIPATPVSPKTAAVAEEEYSTGMLISLVLALVVMLLPGMMLLDTMVHMWSWGEPFVLNSMLMSTIAGWFGL